MGLFDKVRDSVNEFLDKTDLDEKVVAGAKSVKEKVTEALDKTDLDEKVMAGVKSVKDTVTDAMDKSGLNEKIAAGTRTVMEKMDEVFHPDEEKKKLKDQTEKIRQEVESLKNVDISAKMREGAEAVTDAARNHAEAALDDLKKVEQGLNQMAKELKDKASDGLEQFKSAGNEVKEKLADVFEAGKKKAEETRKDAALAKFLADNGIEESAKKIETERADAVRNAAAETAEQVCNMAETDTAAAEKAEETCSAAAQHV